MIKQEETASKQALSHEGTYCDIVRLRICGDVNEEGIEAVDEI